MFSDGDDDNGNNSLTSPCSQQEQRLVQDEDDGASFSIPHAMLTNNTVETIPLLDAATSPSPGNEESLKRPSPSSVGGGRMVSNVWGWLLHR